MWREREERDELDGGEDESFVVLMLNELENTIELLWLWKLLWGHRKLAPVWELACWQKRGFVWWRLLHRPAATGILTAVSRLDLSRPADTTSRLAVHLEHGCGSYLTLPARSPSSYLLNRAHHKNRSAFILMTSFVFMFEVSSYTMSCYLWIIIP